MSPITKKTFLELLQNSIEEPIQKGDKLLVEKTIDLPLFMVTTERSPLLFTFGWDPKEKYNVISLN